MRGKKDARIETRANAPKSKVHGGKALQRLFYDLGKRDPRLNDFVVASIPIPKAIRPKFGLTAAARAAPVARETPAGQARAQKSLAPRKRFAEKIIDAATALEAAPVAVATAALGAPAVAGAAAAWQALGPSHVPNGQTYHPPTRVDVIGRLAAITVDPSNPRHILCASAGGGIWESPDDGATWAPRTDRMPSLAIGAIAFDPKSPKIVYAGSGEGNFYASIGAGVYRSADGGTTWTVLASAPFVGLGFYDLVVDPQNSNLLYAATNGGFYASTNKGTTWSRKRSVKCWGLSVHPTGGAKEILAAFADGLFVSVGATISFANVPLPSQPSEIVRIAVDRVTTSPDVAYVFAATSSSGHLWRRTGTTWKKITPLPSFSVAQAWYDWFVRASPTSPSQVFFGAIDSFRGDLTGTTWRWTNITTQGANSIHPDQHCLTVAPGDSRVVYAGNDGGIYRSANSGGTWKSLNLGLGITEITFLGSDPNTWKWLLAGTQDNGTLRYTGVPKWEHVADGDGGDCGVNPLQPLQVYHSYYSVSLERSSDKGTTWAGLSPPAMQSLFYPPVEVFGTTVAIGGASLAVSRNRGTAWSTVSLGTVGGSVASAMRIPNADTIFVGTTNGSFIRFAWSGTAWARTNLAAPAARYVSCVAVDPSSPLNLWVTFSEVQGPGGRVFRSTNGGSAWVNATGGLPQIPMNSVVVDPKDGKRIFVAADVGVYRSVDGGLTWAVFGTGLPNAIAADLIFHAKDRKLICGTRNRGAWAIDVP